MNAAVSVRGLSKRFGAFVAVDRVSFEIGEGEVFGFLGPNGAGKTTTIKMLTGLLDPTSGEARIAGLDVVGDRWALKSRIGYMSQLFSLYGDLTVAENIDLFAGLYGVRGRRREERRAWILEMAGLAGQAGRLTAELPLGFKQRLALGCAVIHGPPVLFLDEPTSGVDPIARRSFWDLIYELSGHGTTVIVSTHYMEEAEYCHRLALMNRGCLIALDRPAVLRASMSEPLLELRTEDPARAVEAVRSLPGVTEASMYGRRLHVLVKDEERARPALAEALRAAGLEIRSIRRIEPALEDVFVARVRAAGG
ncbi:MAG: ABC transporter ATP-binding protein [Gemmatimonadota bacterium]|jgi:ABC-2 type transport system ATP-binding protein|nr:MAG: ABC transporter ATP-binding protein [Gemmatimonadota bacterium]